MKFHDIAQLFDLSFVKCIKAYLWDIFRQLARN